jgi:hypothetical protein
VFFQKGGWVEVTSLQVDFSLPLPPVGPIVCRGDLNLCFEADRLGILRVKFCLELGAGRCIGANVVKCQIDIG